MFQLQISGSQTYALSRRVEYYDTISFHVWCMQFLTIICMYVCTIAFRRASVHGSEGHHIWRLRVTGYRK